MIFFDGEIYENDMCDKLLARFEDRICDTLGNCRLSAEQVMLAAEKISKPHISTAVYQRGTPENCI